MATRAIQDPLTLLGFRDPVTDDWLAGGSVEFYGAGTLVAKNAWEDKDKVTPITSVTLDSSGQAQVYLDGVYKFVVKNSSGVTKYTLDNLKYQARNTNTLTKSADYTATIEDDYIIVDTDSGPATITLPAVSTVVAPITIKNIGTSGNDITVDGDGSEVIDGAATALISDGASQQYVTDGASWYGAGVATGTNFTSATLISGTGNTFDVVGGVTTINTTYPAASDTVAGIVELATDAETLTGTSTLLAVTPANVASVSPVIQHSVSTVTTGGTTTAIIPGDDTIPQSTEGAEFLTFTFTPKLTTSTVTVKVTTNIEAAINDVLTVALFKDSDTDALCAIGEESDGSLWNAHAVYSFAPGATSEITFKVRYGSVTGTTVNIGSTVPYYGAASITTLEVTETR